MAPPLTFTLAVSQPRSLFTDIACAAKGTQGFENGQWFAWWEQPEDATARWTKHVLAENDANAQG